MKQDVFTFLIGGKAGEGVRKTGSVVARLFAKQGRWTFEMNDYPSLIRGGHNFSVISTSTRRITSHYMKANLMVLLDKRSYYSHTKDVADGGIIIYNSDDLKDVEGIGLPLSTEAKKYPNPSLILGMGAVAIVSAAIGSNKQELVDLIKKEYLRGSEDNIAYAMTIYDLIYPKIGGKFILEKEIKERPILAGFEAIALGAVAAGLDLYYGYPMTPTAGLLHYLAAHDKELGINVIHPENELAVINMAIGSTYVGAKAMIGSSGGGFALMEEAFSLAGMVESPLFCLLSSRPGPSTGVPTYTEQADLFFALNQGHGEFLRIVASPGSIEEAYYLAAELLHLVWRFQTPGILYSDKHINESEMSVEINIDKAKWAEPIIHAKGDFKRYLDTESGISPLLFPISKNLIKWNSYEHDELGITTEEPEKITKMHDKRVKKLKSLIEYLKNLHTVNIFGDKGPVIFTFGSTTMSVLEAVKAGNIDATIVQPIYLSPLPIWELEKFRESRSICVELNSTGQFATLLKDKVGIKPISIIKKYDGRPFEPIELAEKIKEVI